MESVAGSHDPETPSLTKVQVAEIRKRVKAGEKKSALAAEFKVSRQTLYSALSTRPSVEGRRTAHVICIQLSFDFIPQK